MQHKQRRDLMAGARGRAKSLAARSEMELARKCARAAGAPPAPLQRTSTAESQQSEYAWPTMIDGRMISSAGSNAEFRGTTNSLQALMSMSIHGEAVNDSKEAHARAAEQHRRQIHRTRFTIHPHSKKLQRWDCVMIAALIFVATVSPYEVAVLVHGGRGLFIANRVIDLVFLADIVAQFFIAFQEAPERGGTLVLDPARIATAYATSWLALDLVTAVPVDLLLWAAGDDGGHKAGAASSVGAASLVRMLRIVKLARILRASRVYKRMQTQMGLSFGALALIKVTALILIMAHWLACLWVLVGRLLLPSAAEVGAAAAERNRRDGTEARAGPFGSSWIDRAGMADISPTEIYGVALYVAFSNIFSGACVVEPAHAAEFYVQALMMLVGSAVWAYAISSGCSTLATLNPHTLCAAPPAHPVGG